jgi:hypothetical protein
LRDLAWLDPALYVEFKGEMGLFATLVTLEDISDAGLSIRLLASRVTEGFHMNAPNSIVIIDEEF